MQSDRDLLTQALGYMESVGQMDMHPEEWAIAVALRERLAQPEFDSALQSAATTQTTPKLEQPEQSPLDRMAENARELGLDYEPVAWGMRNSRGEIYDAMTPAEHAHVEGLYTVPLYTTPPRCPNCASLEAQNTELDKKLAQYEKHGVTCQTFRHTVEKSCAECNVQEDYTAPQRELQQAESITDAMMNLADRLGSEFDLVDSRAWEHLLVYAPKQPEQEPVAWMSPGEERLEFARKDTVYGSHTIPLYTTPPRREWQGLTAEEIAVLWDVRHDIQGFARAIEAKLREKNA